VVPDPETRTNAQSRTLVRTLIATLVDPTAHKERKLRRLHETYQAALHDAFDADARTMSAVNDVVKSYKLPYQAKDGLKPFVPRLLTEYNAQELDDTHPVRLSNRAATFDRSADRTHEFCWNVPQPGRGTNFWIPIQINPEQRARWHGLLEGTDVAAGELQLIRTDTDWHLHTTVKWSRPEPAESSDPTYVGLDVGETALITGCALTRDTPTDPFCYSGSRAKQLNKARSTTLKRLQERDAEPWRRRQQAQRYENALDDIIETASRRAVDYAEQFDAPWIVLEELDGVRDIRYGAFMNRRLHSWAFGQLQKRIEQKAAEDGIPVSYVPAAYTSQICHACRRIGTRPTQGEFHCKNEACHITTFQADINAAANIARRGDPRGESCLWKSESDDSSGDGRTRDSATGPDASSSPRS
jgi:putative transposase